MSNQAIHRTTQFLWCTRGAAFAIFSLAGLICGMFPEFFLPLHRAEILSTLPALKIMLVSQVIFIVMFLPLLAQHRMVRIGGYLTLSAVEYIIWLGVLLPLYIVAAVLADATIVDVIRCLLYLTAIVMFAWTLGLWAHLNRLSMAGVVFISSLIVIVLPVIYYFFIEFSVDGTAPDWLSQISPINHISNLACSAGTNWYPTPIWTLIIWPLVAMAAVIVYLPIRSVKRVEENLPND